ncbi:hypothetical protein PROFUN_06070 [Planoprotostelium fungivorum]|uniref:FERM domain-containing protein n=1 Tax=Planoprotostelium fungivorum TaxID=1890364 RepID=A0A2P6NPW6_9EUKA|nr:hypothetical protein PROFUN_06070 [Planoprotostelium fungivorum]
MAQSLFPDVSVRVYFLDQLKEEHIELSAFKTTRLGELWSWCCESLGFPLKTVGKYFSIWGHKGPMEIPLDTELSLEHMVKKLPQAYTQASPVVDSHKEFRLYFRRSATAPSSMDKALMGNISYHQAAPMLFHEAARDVQNSHYVFDEEDSLKLARLQLQILRGEGGGKRFDIGQSRADMVAKLIPRHLLKERTASRWEDLIFNQVLNHDGSDLISIYLDHVRGFPQYGSVFSEVTLSSSSDDEDMKYDDITMGINERGIHFVRFIRGHVVLSENPQNTSWNDLATLSIPFSSVMACHIQGKKLHIHFNLPTKNNASQALRRKRWKLKSPNIDILIFVFQEWIKIRKTQELYGPRASTSGSECSSPSTPSSPASQRMKT